MMKKVLINLFLCVVLLVGCTSDKEELLLNPSGNDCAGVNAGFANDVWPIIQANCQGCHGAGSTNGPGALTNYTQISNAATRIKAAVESGSMPKGAGPLPAAQVRIIRCWVNSGTPNN